MEKLLEILKNSQIKMQELVNKLQSAACSTDEQGGE